MADSLSASIQPYIDRHELAGAVMFAADKSGIVNIEAAGWADVDAKKPMAPDSLFWAASQTKPLAAAALMMLVDEGKLTIDDPVEKHLPEFAGQMVVASRTDAEVVLRKPARPPTVKDLLTHSGGMPFKTSIEEPTFDRLPIWAAVRSYAMAPLEYEPGSRTMYSNAGINTVGRIVEVLSGQPFETFLDKRLLHPLGMRDTTFWPSEAQAARLAESYRANQQSGQMERTTIGQFHYPLTDRRRRFPFPAGGIFSTAHDLATFYRMMLNGGSLDGRVYLRESTVREMTRNHIPPGIQDTRGLGFFANDKEFSHGGAYGTWTRAYPASGLILGWLVQHDSFPGAGGEAGASYEKAALAHYAAR